MNIRFSICIASLAMAATGAAQPEPHAETTLVAVPHGLSVDGFTTTVASDKDKILVKRVGYYDEDSMPGSGSPGEYPAPPSAGMVDYSTALILQGVSGLDVDAFSIGLDWVLSNGDGVEFVPPGHWGGLTFSVTRDSAGEAGGVIRREFEDVGQRAGGDLFFYILPDSTLPPGLPDETYLVQDAADMDIHDLAAPPAPGHGVGGRPEMDAHDLYVSLLHADNPAFAAAFNPVVPEKAFFSVTDATKGLVPSGWWSGTTPSGATIFETTWTGVGWATPSVFLAYCELGLAFDEELDACAIDLTRMEILFSTKTSARDEILWLPLPTGITCGGAGGDSTPRVYRTPDGTPVSRRSEVRGTDDLDGICSLDPGGSQFYESLFATPAIELPWIFPPEASVSAFRREDLISQTVQWTSTLVGWPSPGRPQPSQQPGVAGCMIVFPGQSPFIPISPAFPRNVFSVWLGDPREVQLGPIPLNHPFVNSGIQVGFQWLAIDQNTLQFEVPYTAIISL